MEQGTRIVVIHGPSTIELEAALARAGLELLTRGADTAIWGERPKPAQEMVRSTGVALPRPALLTIPEAAALLGVGRSTVYRLMRAGDLDGLHVGRSVRIPAASVDELVERLGARGTPTTPAAERRRQRPDGHRPSVHSHWEAIDPPLAAPAPDAQAV